MLIRKVTSDGGPACVVTAADAVDRTVAVLAVASGVLTPRVATAKFESPAVLLGVKVAVATPLEFVIELMAVTVPDPVPPTVQTTGTPTSAAELLSRSVAVTVYGEPPAVKVVEDGDSATVRVPLLSTS
ncbi:MAG: hypothetical protein JRM96_01040 [Nitrososphaerota archaeon]|nr:hypothetical protein [Nitrososphaerota archaeon]MDG6952020.1 hypothetical protein [Nitrososphaerota archaeon]MDG7004223.1 hypothetical protein [Nitrososphaerota archaeon]